MRKSPIPYAPGTEYAPAMDAIRVQHLTKRYAETLAVDDIAFAVPAGATVGLLGGNGAGKTTTIAMLLGLLIPTAGTIEVLGHDMARDRFAALARMNFSSPYVSLPQRLSVAENLAICIMSPTWSIASPNSRSSWTSAICWTARRASCRPGRGPASRWPRR
jgi:ABC-type branched-subunit amino acid transport system ATPase component